MSESSDRVIIELYGLPGAGKSTLARQLAKEGGFVHVTATGVSRAEYVKLTLRYPHAVSLWLLLIIKNYLQTRSIKQLRYNISLLFVSLKKMHQARLCQDRLVVIDEGLVQRFLSYSDIILTENEITRVLRASLIGTVVILLNDRVIIKDRYDEAHDRGKEGLDRLSKWRNNLNQNLPKIGQILRKNGQIRHFETKTMSINDILQKLNQS